MSAAPLQKIFLRDVAVRFGKVDALAGVDVAFQAGELLMLAGPNGAGKSTLLKVLLGLVSAARGQLLVDGKPRNVDNDLKRQLGYLPEAVAFADNLTGRQVLSFFARARGVPKAKERIGAVLERVGLADAQRRAVRGYSRGMRQRLGLGLAILHEPQLLVLDEPTGGLDQEGLSVLWTVLEEWRAANRMVLCSSHDLTLLERRVDRICVLRAGKVVADDTPARLRELVQLPVRVSFGLNGNPEQVDQLATAVEQWEAGREYQRTPGSLSVRVAPGSLLELMDLRAAHPGAVNRLRVEEPGFDAVYERLLEREGPWDA